MPLLPHSFFQALFDHISDAVYVINPDDATVVAVNAAGCTELGMDKSEVLDHSVLSLNKDVIGLAQWHEIATSIKAAGHYAFIGRHRRKDGSDFPVEVRTNHFTFEGRSYFVSVARDISRRMMHEETTHNDDYIRMFALNEASDGLWDWNLQDNSLFFSPQWYRMMGYGPHEIEHPSLTTWKDAVHPADEERVVGLLNAHLQGKSSRYEAKYRLKNRNGDYLWVHDRGMVVQRDADQQPIRMVGLVLDITQSQKLAEQLLKHSQCDDLTGLYNRKTGYELFTQYLNISLHQNTQMQVVMFDIDRFKAVNDNYGHLTGDNAIRHFATTLRSLIRKTDLLFRWGGEEFLLLCPDTSQDTAQNMVARLLSAYAASDFVTDEGVALHMTASAGISGFPNQGESIKQLVKAADEAMYTAKAQGRNQVCVSG